MNIETRISEIKHLERRSNAIYKISMAAGLLLYASLFIAVLKISITNMRNILPCPLFAFLTTRA